MPRQLLNTGVFWIMCACPLRLVLSLGTTEQSLSPSSLLPPSWAFVHTYEIPWELSLLQAQQSQISLCLLIYQVLQSIIYGLLLVLLKPVPDSLVPESLAVDPPGTPDMSQNCWAEGKDHLSRPRGNTYPNTGLWTLPWGHIAHISNAPLTFQHSWGKGHFWSWDLDFQIV